MAHQLDGHEFEQALEVGDGKGRLECCSPQGGKELDRTEWLNWTDFALLKYGFEQKKKSKIPISAMLPSWSWANYFSSSLAFASIQWG